MTDVRLGIDMVCGMVSNWCVPTTNPTEAVMQTTIARPIVCFWTWKDYGKSGISGNPDFEGEFVAQVERHGHVILTDDRTSPSSRGVWDKRPAHDDADFCEGAVSHASYRENEAAGIFDRGWWVTDKTGRR